MRERPVNNGNTPDDGNVGPEHGTRRPSGDPTAARIGAHHPDHLDLDLELDLELGLALNGHGCPVSRAGDDDVDEWGRPVFPPEHSEAEIAAILASNPVDQAEFIAYAAASDGVSGRAIEPFELLVEDVDNRAPDAVLAGGLDALSQDATGLGSLDEEELARVIAGWERVTSWARAAQARVAAELMTRTGDVLSRDSTAGQLAGSMHVTTSEAWQIASRAEGTASHPQLAQALTTGYLDTKKADTFLRAGTGLTPAERGQAITDLLPRAPHHTWRWLSEQMNARAAALHGQRVRRRAIVDQCNVWVEPACPGLGRITAEVPVAEAALTFNTIQAAAKALQNVPGETRSLRTLRAVAFTALLTGSLVLPAEDTAAASGTVSIPATSGGEPTTSARPEDGAHSGTRPVPTRLATGLVSTLPAPLVPVAGTAPAAPPRLVEPVKGTDLVPMPAESVDAGPGLENTSVRLTAPVTAGVQVRAITVPATVHLTVSAATLLNPADSTPGILDGIGPIPADDAARIAASGTWRRLLTDPVSGVLTDYSTRTYTPGPHLRAAVTARDRVCRFPGCDRPVTLNGRATGDLDHIEAYTSHHPTGAPDQTRADNLHLLCRKHHNLKTHASWKVTRDPATGTTRWTTPSRTTTHTVDPTVADPTIRYGLAQGLTLAGHTPPDTPGPNNRPGAHNGLGPNHQPGRIPGLKNHAGRDETRPPHSGPQADDTDPGQAPDQPPF